MKKSFKTTSLIAAIGMMVYTIYVLTRYVLGECFGIHYVFNLATEIRIRLIYDILPISLIIAGIGLWKQRPSDAASKSFRVFTKCFFVALVGTLVFSPLYTIQIAGSGYIRPSIYWRALMLISGIVWLFMLRKQASEEASPRSYRVTLILAILLLTLPIILEALSGISCMLNGHVLNFDSSTIKAWLRWIVPTLVLIHFVFPQIKAINTTRNSHCTLGSFDKSTFNRNRTVTLVVVGIAIVALCAEYICFFAEKRLCFREDIICNTIDDIACVCLCVAGVALLASWIMLSIMAFRQLPNPRGYKIYNTVCQIITWGSFGVTFLAPNGIEEIFITIFFVSFCAFFITTTIRVISYSLPTGIDKLIGIELKEGAIIPN